MKFEVILMIHMIAFEFIFYYFDESAEAAYPPKDKKKRRKPKKGDRKKQILEDHIQCFECIRDLSHIQPFFGDDLCYNPLIDPDEVLEESLVTCPKGSTVCQMDIQRVNGVFIAVERKCASLCQCLCKTSGYGLEREICSECFDPVDYLDFSNQTEFGRPCRLPPRENWSQQWQLTAPGSNSTAEYNSTSDQATLFPEASIVCVAILLQGFYGLQ